MSRESLSAVLRSSPCFLIQIFYGGQKGKLHGKLSVANEDLSHDTRKWSGRMNSEGESCHSGKLHLPFAMKRLSKGRLRLCRWRIASTSCTISLRPWSDFSFTKGPCSKRSIPNSRKLRR